MERQIQAVTFDVGGTLIEPWPSVGHVYAEVALRHGIKNISPELLNERFQSAWRAQNNFSDTRAGWERLVDAVFDRLTPAPPSVTFFPELYDRFARPEAWRVFDDVRPALEELAARGFRLAVISNWDERLRVLLRRLGLHDRFETLVISCESGCSKPSPAIFAGAATRLALPPAAILHVGDSLEMDVRGAQAAGFRALHLRRDRDRPDAGEASSLRGLVAGVASD